MSSSKHASIDKSLPPALPSMWRALKRGYEAEPHLLVAAFGFCLLAATPDALLALWFKFLGDGIAGHRCARTSRDVASASCGERGS